SFLVEAAGFAWMIPPIVGGLAGGMALFIALAALATRWLRLKGPAKVVAFAAFWVIGEWLRGHLLSGFPWDLAGYTLAFSDALNQYAAIGGIWGLSLLTVAVAAMPAVLGGTPPRTAPVDCGAAALVAPLLYVGGAVRLAGAEDVAVPHVLVRIVQPNIAQTLKWKEGVQEQNVALHRQLTIVVPGEENVTAAIWPETAVPY